MAPRITKFGTGSFPGKGKLKLSPEQEKIHGLKKKLKETELERDILKKTISIFPKGGRLLIFSINDHEKIYSIEEMYRVLKVSPSSYYNWKRQILSERKLI